VQHPPLELSATAPVQAHHLESGGWGLSSVEVLRQGDRATGCRGGTPRAGPVLARMAARQATVQHRPLELRATAPVQPNHLEDGGVVLSSVEVPPGRPGDRGGPRAPRRHMWLRARPRCSTPPLELSATAPVQPNHLEAEGVVLSSVEVLRQGDRATEAAHGPHVGACGRAPGHGSAAPRHSSSVPQPLCNPTTSRLEVWCCPVSRFRQGDRATEAAHGPRVGTCGRAPGHGGAAPRHPSSVPQPLCNPTTSRLEVWCCPVSRCSARATGRPRRPTGPTSARLAARQATGVRNSATRAQCHSPCASQPPRGWRCGAVQCRGSARATGRPRRPTGPSSARVAARQATGLQHPATRAQCHSPCVSQPPRGWGCGAVQCRGAPPGRPGDRGGPRAPRRRVWPRAWPRGCSTPPLELSATAPV